MLTGQPIRLWGETITPPGQSYGSLSNLITEITVVAWDEGINRYALKTFHRSDVESTAFLTHLVEPSSPP